MANHKEKKTMWNGNIILIKEGQFITGRDKLAEATGIHRSSIERILSFLENEHQIEQQKTTKFRLITIVNWKEYQNTSNESSNKRATNEQQMSTNKNDNNVKNEKNTLISEQSSRVNEIMGIFIKENPSLKWGNKTQRRACHEMLQKWPQPDAVKNMALQVLEAQKERYAPRATTPLKMWEKIAEFRAYFSTRKSNTTKVVKV